MTEIRDELKQRFDDGEIPRGSDFATMIDAFALDDALQTHVADFTAFLPDGNQKVVLDHEVDTGDVVTWTIGIGDRGALRVDRSEAASDPTLLVSAWSGSRARFGMWKSGSEPVDPVEDRDLAEPLRSMSFADADGSWKAIVPHESIPRAAEIVAYVDGVPDTGRPVRSLLMDLLWPHPPMEAICHAVASCRVQGRRPHIAFTGDPWTSQFLHGWPIVLMPLPVVLILAGGLALFAFLSSPSFWALLLLGVPGVLALLLALRLYRQAWNARRGLQLRWHVVRGARWRGTAEHSLEIRAGPFPGKTSPRIRYHVTRLWG